MNAARAAAEGVALALAGALLLGLFGAPVLCWPVLVAAVVCFARGPFEIALRLVPVVAVWSLLAQTPALNLLIAIVAALGAASAMWLSADARRWSFEHFLHALAVTVFANVVRVYSHGFAALGEAVYALFVVVAIFAAALAFNEWRGRAGADDYSFGNSAA